MSCASAAVGTWSVVVTATETQDGHQVQTSVVATLAIPDPGGNMPRVLRLSSPDD